MYTYIISKKIFLSSISIGAIGIFRLVTNLLDKNKNKDNRLKGA